jgi:hypothetical protein
VDPVDAPEVLDDFELGDEETIDIKDREVNKQKLRRRIEQFKMTLLNPCRPGKKLLVLDIDYTLFDHRSTAENPRELMRPCKSHQTSNFCKQYRCICFHVHVQQIVSCMTRFCSCSMAMLLLTTPMLAEV